MTNFDSNTYFAGAALTRGLSASGNDKLKKYAHALRLNKNASTLAAVQNNDLYPQELADAISHALALTMIQGTVLPYDIAFQIEASYRIALTVPENLEDDALLRKDFFERLNSEFGDDMFPLDEDGILDLPDFDPDDPNTSFQLPNEPVKPAGRDIEYPELSDNFSSAKDAPTPLVLDLDGDGVEVSSLSGSESVYWDVDLDGFAEASAWVTGGDGLLAIDLNSDGVINDHAELFGDQSGSPDGFAALAVYDTNSDGYITAADTQFDDLFVWIDVDNDGFSDASELHTLDTLGITSIALGASTVSYDINGSEVKLESTFTINGNTRTIVDVWFDIDNVNTVYVGNQEVLEEALYLPTLRGYGEIPDLLFRTSQDEDLYDLVLELGQAEAGEMISTSFDLEGRVRDILFRWAGVDGVNPTSRGTDIDARVLEFLEEYFGEEFYQDAISSSNPNAYAAGFLNAAFETIFSDACIDLLTQLDARVYVGQAPVYDNITGTVDGDYMISNLLFNEGAGVDYLYGGEKSDGFIWSLGDGDDVFTEEGGGLDKVLFADGIGIGDVVFESSGADLKIHVGTETITLVDQFHDYLYGDGTDYQIEYAVFEDGTHLSLLDNLTFTGTASADSIYGYLTNDVLKGLAGADYLIGREGDDRYLWDIGDGNDTIIEDGGADELVMAAGITVEDVRLARSGSFDLEVYVGTEKITISDQLRDAILSTTDGYAVEVIRFSDNSTLDLVNDLTFRGTSSSDTMYGLADNNILIGAGGDDSLLGGEGDDRYLWGIGDGNDTIIEDGGADELVMAAGITVEDVRLARSGSFDLEVYVGTEKITISDQLRDAILSTTDGYAVEVIRFSDNSTLDLVNDLTFRGTSSSDTMYGLADNNILIGAGGDDALLGGAGDDVLYGGAGTDDLYGQDGADIFVFEAASAFSNIDTVQDFDLSEDDVIDISDLLTEYDPLTDVITDFVQITDNGTHSYLSVDADGGANNFVQIATLLNVTSLTDEAALVSGGYLKVA